MGKFSFRDNRNILNAMLSKPDGLLAVIDEQSRASDATDESILSSIHDLNLPKERISIFIFFKCFSDSRSL
jgi:myosin heavy subunit